MVYRTRRSVKSAGRRWTSSRPARGRLGRGRSPRPPRSRLHGFLGEGEQLAERRAYDEREAVEVERDLVAAGERIRDRALDLGEALVVDGAVDGQVRPFERGTGADLEACPQGRGGVHARNNAGAPKTLRQIDGVSALRDETGSD